MQNSPSDIPIGFLATWQVGDPFATYAQTVLIKTEGILPLRTEPSPGTAAVGGWVGISETKIKYPHVPSGYVKIAIEHGPCIVDFPYLIRWYHIWIHILLLRMILRWK